MKKGISIWAFGSMPLAQAFPLAKQSGFDGVELGLAESGELTLQTTQAEAEQIKALADQNELALYSIATGLFWSYSPTSNDESVCQKAREIAKKQIQLARWMGCDTVLIVPGSVDEQVPYDIAYERAFAIIKELEPYARDHGVVMGIENVWNKMLLSPLEMKTFIDDADSPYIRAYFDVGNVVRDGYPEHWIKILSGRIAKVHFKDYQRDVGTLNGFVDLLQGDVDYKAVMAALHEIGYQDWVTAELFPTPDTDFPVWIRSISESMDLILKEDV